MEHDFTRLHRRPLVALDVVRQCDQRGEHTDGLDQHALALVVLRLRGPSQERGNVLGDLGGRRGRAVAKLERLRMEWTQLSIVVPNALRC